MVATRDGELFLMQAEKLVNNTDTFEHSFKHNEESTTSFRIALPRGSYLTKAFARTLNAVAEDHPVQVTFNETNNEEVIQCVSAQGYDVGIIRLPIEFESNYKKLLAEKQLKFQEIMVFRFVVVMHKDHPLANREYVHFSDLVNYTALVHGDNHFLTFSDAETDKLYRTHLYKNSISIFERGSQFDFLRDIPGAFMLISPLPQELLNAYGDHNAEWNFLKGAICTRRGWLDEAKRYYETAVQMDPDNREYQRALDMAEGRGGAYRPEGYSQMSSAECGDGTCLRLCGTLLCCNALGGGYFCCI